MSNAVGNRWSMAGLCAVPAGFSRPAPAQWTTFNIGGNTTAALGANLLLGFGVASGTTAPAAARLEALWRSPNRRHQHANDDPLAARGRAAFLSCASPP